MKRRLLAVILLVVGSCLILYPIVGNIVNVVRQNNIQAEYNSMVQQLDSAYVNQLKSDADEYNRKLASGELSAASTDEDSLPDEYDDGSGYNQALDIGAEAIAFIKIPKIDVELPIYRGTSAKVLDNGIGHLRQSSLPVGGESSHCVLTGHTGLPSSILFTDINKLEQGDLFYIQCLDEIHAYSVDQIKIVSPTDSSDLKIIPGHDYVTLLTCYPYGINSHRLLVRGERIPFDGEITFGGSGKIESITQRPNGSEVSEDMAADEASILDDMKSSSRKVSVYGLNVPLGAVIAGVSIIAVLVAAALTFTIIGVVKHKNKENDNGGDSSE